jgi:hypothetical protein
MTLLQGFSGYRAAIVGWDRESLIDLPDLETDWRNGEAPGYNGLVLANDLCQRWQLGPEWVAFGHGHRWLLAASDQPEVSILGRPVARARDCSVPDLVS